MSRKLTKSGKKKKKEVKSQKSIYNKLPSFVVMLSPLEVAFQALQMVAAAKQ